MISACEEREEAAGTAAEEGRPACSELQHPLGPKEPTQHSDFIGIS